MCDQLVERRPGCTPTAAPLARFRTVGTGARFRQYSRSLALTVDGPSSSISGSPRNRVVKSKLRPEEQIPIEIRISFRDDGASKAEHDVPD